MGCICGIAYIVWLSADRQKNGSERRVPVNGSERSVPGIADRNLAGLKKSEGKTNLILTQVKSKNS
jgi:hypothetical protein